MSRTRHYRDLIAWQKESAIELLDLAIEEAKLINGLIGVLEQEPR